MSQKTNAEYNFSFARESSNILREAGDNLGFALNRAEILMFLDLQPFKLRKEYNLSICRFGFVS